MCGCVHKCRILISLCTFSSIPSCLIFALFKIFTATLWFVIACVASLTCKRSKQVARSELEIHPVLSQLGISKSSSVIVSPRSHPVSGIVKALPVTHECPNVTPFASSQRNMNTILREFAIDCALSTRPPLREVLQPQQGKPAAPYLAEGSDAEVFTQNILPNLNRWLFHCRHWRLAPLGPPFVTASDFPRS